MVLLLRDRHTKRLKNGACSITTGLVFMEALTHLERTADHCSSIGVMLLARDLNGRRIYESKEDLAKVLNVANIFTVEQFEGLEREDDKGKKFALLGLFVNMANYQFGCTKGGEVTSFEDFDIDYNQYKYLMETRLSGALIDPYSAIVLEEAVVAG